MFRDGVPNPDLPGVAGGDQLVTNEEESLHRYVQTEDACRRERRRETERSLIPTKVKDVTVTSHLKSEVACDDV